MNESATNGGTMNETTEALTKDEVRALGTRLAGVCDGAVDEAAEWIGPLVVQIANARIGATLRALAVDAEALRAINHNGGVGDLPLFSGTDEVSSVLSATAWHLDPHV